MKIVRAISLSGILLRCAAVGAFIHHPRAVLDSTSRFRLKLFNFLSSSTRKSTLAQTKMSSTDHPLQTEPPSSGVICPCGSDVKIILGSQSSTRRLILKEMKTEFECISPKIDEKAIRHELPEELVLALARAKASALLEDRRVVGGAGTTLLLTCDQVVVHNGKILEKPDSKEQAAQFIRSYGSSPCSTVGATIVTNVETGQKYEAVDIAKIFFRPIPEAVIQQLLDKGEVMYCAGGLMVEAEEVQPCLERIEGGMDAHTYTFHDTPYSKSAPLCSIMCVSVQGGLMVEAAEVQPYLERIEGGMDAVMGLSKRTVHRLLSAALSSPNP